MLPQKKGGYRKIVVAGNLFNWRLKTQIEECPVGIQLVYREKQFSIVMV